MTTPLSALKEFLHTSPTPFHAVQNLSRLLGAKGFLELSETQSWKMKPGGKYFVCRNRSSIVAFRLGEGNPSESGFRLVGAHTDSPCLRLRPRSDLKDRHYLRLGVEVYGSPLLSTWFDRDLSLAGRVFFTGKRTKGPQSALINFQRPIGVVPNLAIHLNRSVNENRSINTQTEMPPLVALLFSKSDSIHAAILSELARQGVEGADEVVSHDLFFYDTQPPAVVGLNSEFLSGSRLDNLLSCFVAAVSLTESSGNATGVLACNDHEEVGSASAAGAQGPFLKNVLERLAGSSEDFSRAIAHSVLVSTDNSHGVHPSYPEKHDVNHGPVLNHGPAIKTNANQRYATSGETAALFTHCCALAEVPVQQFVSRNDVACGSTIGPITATILGVRTVDVGVPTFAMHSIRELAGVRDADFLGRALVEFYRCPGWD